MSIKVIFTYIINDGPSLLFYVSSRSYHDAVIFLVSQHINLYPLLTTIAAHFSTKNAISRLVQPCYGVLGVIIEDVKLF